jgi:hypothetical protein
MEEIYLLSVEELEWSEVYRLNQLLHPLDNPATDQQCQEIPL